MIVRIERAKLNEFRKVCRQAYPNESCAALFGKRLDGGGFEISKIMTFPYTVMVGGIDFGDKQIRASKMAALRRETDWLGTIHSHCGYDTCAHPSDTDIRTGIRYGEAIIGIVYVYERYPNDGRFLGTDVRFYIPTPQPVIEYL